MNGLKGLDHPLSIRPFGLLLFMLLLGACSDPGNKTSKKTDEKVQTSALVAQIDRGTEKGLDLSAPVVLSVVDANECVMCFSLLYTRIPALKKKHGSSWQNIVLAFPDSRKVEIDPLLQRYFSKMKDKVQVLWEPEPVLETMERDHTLPTGSFYTVLAPDSEILSMTPIKKRKQ